ncbi:MAG: penicillin acylase family protein [Desulfobacterales bacterium]|jgi:penicillin amidase|nr:penicillin acylase family protein [Desulfobacterales bacterium]
MKISRDRRGIAHVEGKDLPDVFMGMGYAHGKDRALQMLLMRILGRGQGSELLESSDEMLGIDIFFRKMNWTGHMTQELEMLTPEAKNICGAYCEGVNLALSEGIPWEFKLVGYKPDPWSMDDIFLFSRMMGYLTLAQSQGEMERFFVEMVQAGVAEEKLQELFPGILGGLDIDLLKKVKLQERIISPVSLWNKAAPLMMASNNWVVSGKKTESGKPILANDPHLEVNRLPNVWYEIVLKTQHRFAVGASIPGAPGLPIGRNPNLAWGATYTFMDSTDSWIENCQNGKFFREPDRWVPFRVRKEVIQRKKKEPQEIIFYENDHGVLDGDPNKPGYYLSTAWAPATSGGVSITNLLNMWHVKTVQEGMDVLGRVETAWNFVLADIEGNIGYQMSGMMPKRREGISGFVPLPGWDPENDWQGFEDLKNLPRIYNPEQGYFVTANQDLNAFGKAKPINVVMGPYRSDRIGDLLARNNSLTTADIYHMHMDVYSKEAEIFMQKLTPLIPDTPWGHILKKWDMKYTPDSQGAWLFEKFYKALREEVFGTNGLGVGVTCFLDEHTGIFNDFYLNFNRVMASETSVWFNGRKREDVYKIALDKIAALTPKSWGEDQQIMLTHIFFSGKLPRWLGFDRGPVTIIGNRATPHQGQIFESAGRKTTFAPSYRMVIDLATDEVNSVLAGGPSDRRFSKWYCSDLFNWIHGKYKKLSPTPTDGYVKF